MPELPEVETLKRGLASRLSLGIEMTQVKTSSHALRFPFPKGLARKLKGQKLKQIRRRAKYLIFLNLRIMC